jgi:hypothetical protein
MKAATKWILDRWKGRTVVCIASGPSLTAEDCELVHRAGHPAIVTNTTFRLCPWADVLFGFDIVWWRTYRSEVEATFRGIRVTCSSQGRSVGVFSTENLPGFWHFGNSGTAAISLAVFGGASRIVLLGYDCQASNGRTHWHGDHPEGLSNARSLHTWPAKFLLLAQYAKRKNVPVLNASRETRLTCFPRVRLEDAL